LELYDIKDKLYDFCVSNKERIFGRLLTYISIKMGRRLTL